MKQAKKRFKSKKHKLYRSKNDKIIAGLLGGISEYFDIDSTLVRIVWLLMLALTGFVPGTLVYLLSIVLVPLAKK